MVDQVPTIFFAVFLAWSAGTFGTLCLLGLQQKGRFIQWPSLVVSAVTLVIGFVFLVVSLSNPQNLFNGFGNISSAYTQQLIAIILAAIAMALYFLMLYRSEENRVPFWLNVVGLILALFLIIAMSRSAMFPFRAARGDLSPLLLVWAASLILGPGTIGCIYGISRKEEGLQQEIGVLNIIGTIVNAVLSTIFLILMQNSLSAALGNSLYSDPTRPQYIMGSGNIDTFLAGDGLAITLTTAIAIVVSLVCAVVGYFRPRQWAAWGTVIVICGFVGSVALRSSLLLMGSGSFSLN